jgi:hypothetical protein
VPVGGWDTAPPCIQHDVPGADGVYKAYEKCADFFTFGPGSTVSTATDGVATSYWILTALGFTVMVVALVAWVVTEDRKLKLQAARLLMTGQAGTVVLAEEVPQPGTGGPV